MATLTITFTGTTPAPIGGYVVKYWPVGRPNDGDGKTVTASPAVFNNVPAGVYDGTILTIKQGQNIIATVSSPVTTSNTPSTVASANIPVGNYTWILTEVNCSNGSGVSSFSMSNT